MPHIKYSYILQLEQDSQTSIPLASEKFLFAGNSFFFLRYTSTFFYILTAHLRLEPSAQEQHFPKLKDHSIIIDSHGGIAVKVNPTRTRSTSRN